MSSHILQKNSLHLFSLSLSVIIFSLPGCSTAKYVTPGQGVSIASLAKADDDISQNMLREPAASFPARIAIARVQGPGYFSYRADSYGSGRYSVVTTRDIERDEDFRRLTSFPMVAGVAQLNRMVLQPQLDSVKDLRLGASTLKTDLLLAYTIDTRFRIDDRDIGPMAMISLGMLPTKQAKVTATASLAIFDVRTGYVYGLAESTAQEKKMANSWTSEQAVEDTRQRAERKAFEGMLTEFDGTWKGIVDQYAAKSQQAAASN